MPALIAPVQLQLAQLWVRDAPRMDVGLVPGCGPGREQSFGQPRTARRRSHAAWLGAVALTVLCSSGASALPAGNHLQAPTTQGPLVLRVAEVVTKFKTFLAIQSGQESRATDAPRPIRAADAEELRQAIEQERARTKELNRDLQVARRDLDAALALLRQAREQWGQIAEASENETAKVRVSLQQERERAQHLEQELSAARRDLDLQAELASAARPPASPAPKDLPDDASALRKQLQEARERAQRLERDLAAAAREAQTGPAATAAAAVGTGPGVDDERRGLQQSLDQERAQAEQLQRDLAKTQRDLDAKTILLKTSSEEAARSEKRATEATIALKDERERAEGLARELSIARAKIFAYEANAEANDQAVRLEISAQSRQLPAAQECGGGSGLQQRLAAFGEEALTRETGPGAEAVAPTPAWQPAVRLFRSAKPRTERSLMESIVAAADGTSAAVGVADAQLATEVRLQPATPAKPSAPRSREEPRPPKERADPQKNSEQNPAIPRLVTHARVLLGQGDIGGARALLERASDMGSAQAAFALAETYDPRMLSKWNTFGTRADPARARDLYAKAEAGGVLEAKERSRGLVR